MIEETVVFVYLSAVATMDREPKRFRRFVKDESDPEPRTGHFE